MLVKLYMFIKFHINRIFNNESVKRDDSTSSDDSSDVNSRYGYNVY